MARQCGDNTEVREASCRTGLRRPAGDGAEALLRFPPFSGSSGNFGTPRRSSRARATFQGASPQSARRAQSHRVRAIIAGGLSGADRSGRHGREGRQGHPRSASACRRLGCLLTGSGCISARSIPREFKVLQGSFRFRLSPWEQSFAALAALASLAVCSCR